MPFSSQCFASSPKRTPLQIKGTKQSKGSISSIPELSVSGPVCVSVDRSWRAEGGALGRNCFLDENGNSFLSGITVYLYNC
jgi:hypothetical protein